jgi:hypothetical protein
MTRKRRASTIPVPAYVLSDEQLLEIAQTLQEVDKEVGGDAESTAAIEALLNELHYRKTTVFKLVRERFIATC